MIGKLQGNVQEAGKREVLIETPGGVGYTVTLLPSTKEKLLKEQRGAVYTHTIFRNSIEIFGFLTKEEQSTFLLFLSITGIGPKKAMAILGKAPTPVLLEAIRSGNPERLKDLGVGLKDAQKIIIELQKKIDLAEKQDGNDDVAIALTAFGYSKKEIQKAIKQVNKKDGIEKQIQTALRNI